MAANYLEQLVAEWYEYKGYLVRRNVLVGRRAKGGYECELDVVAYHPGERRLVHVEPSMDASSWAVREDRFRKKFEAGRRHIPALFPHFGSLPEPEQIALFCFASNRSRTSVGGGIVRTVRDFMREIFSELSSVRIATNAVPEHLAILRSFQFVCEARHEIMAIWSSGTTP
jgi:hypothetical protein